MTQMLDFPFVALRARPFTLALAAIALLVAASGHQAGAQGAAPEAAPVATGPGSIVKGTVKEVDARGAIIDLGDGIEGSLRASELARERVEDARTVLKVGDPVEARFTGVDRKSRAIVLSIRAIEAEEEAEAVQQYRGTDSATGTSLGDLLKEQISGQ